MLGCLPCVLGESGLKRGGLVLNQYPYCMSALQAAVEPILPQRWPLEMILTSLLTELQTPAYYHDFQIQSFPGLFSLEVDRNALSM